MQVANKRILVVGMARSGIAAAKLLCKAGAKPILNDSKEEAAFGDADLDARLIYVCLTRALHQLAVLYCGPLTPLLREEG